MLKEKIDEFKDKYMIYTENIDGDDEEQLLEGRPLTDSSLGESADSVKSSLTTSVQSKEEQEKILKTSFWMPVETEGLSEA